MRALRAGRIRPRAFVPRAFVRRAFVRRAFVQRAFVQRAFVQRAFRRRAFVPAWASPPPATRAARRPPDEVGACRCAGAAGSWAGRSTDLGGLVRSSKCRDFVSADLKRIARSYVKSLARLPNTEGRRGKAPPVVPRCVAHPILQKMKDLYLCAPPGPCPPEATLAVCRPMGRASESAEKRLQRRDLRCQ